MTESPSSLCDKTVKLKARLVLKSTRKNSVHLPEERVRSPFVYADGPKQDDHQQTEAANYTEHNVERVRHTIIGTGRRGGSGF